MLSDGSVIVEGSVPIRDLNRAMAWDLPDDEATTVAGLVINNDFGAAYDGGFRAWIAQSPLKDKVNYVTEKIEPTAP